MQKLFLYRKKKLLGTAGGLSLLKKKLKQIFFLTNCDVLHDFSYYDFFKFHKNNKFYISLVGSIKNYTLPYGICDLDKKGILKKIHEKPTYNITINTGLYLLNKEVLKTIPKNKFYLFTELIEKAKLMKKKSWCFSNK